MLLCDQVPIRLPADVRTTDVAIADCRSCKLRLVALTAGTGVLTKRANGVLSVSENPTTSLYLNGLEHTLIDAAIHFPTSQRHTFVASVAEARFYFQRTTKHTERIVLCIPIVVAAANAANYFQTLGQITSKQATMATLLREDTVFLQYLGAIGCAEKEPRPAQWIVSLTPARIRQSDMDRLVKLAGGTEDDSRRKTPIAPNQLSLLTRIRSITLQTKDSRIRSTAGAAQTTTAQIKCRPLDRARDIRDGKIYVGGDAVPGDSTLEKELEQAAYKDAVGAGSDPVPGLAPADIERTMAIVFGVAIGLLIVSVFVVFYFRRTTWGYDAVQNQYTDILKNASVSVGDSLKKSGFSLKTLICDGGK
jgi:hypothetical protein